MRMGAFFMISVSARMASGTRLYSVVFTPFTIMLEELEAYPSMEGAVPTTREGLPVAWPTTLHKSLITPEPTASR